MARERPKSARRRKTGVQTRLDREKRRKAALKGAKTRRKKADLTKQAEIQRKVQEGREVQLQEAAHAAELKASGLTYTEIAEKLDIPRSTAHYRVHQWWAHSARSESVDEIRVALSGQYEFLYTKLVGQFAIVQQVVEPLLITESVRLTLAIVDRMARVVELHAKVLGIYSDAANVGQLNVGHGAGGQFNVGIPAPNDPQKREEYVDLLRRADAIAEEDGDGEPVESSGSGPPRLPG